jgi:tRNA threonylcarbamoyladenosine biosynthesis protein TsaB
MHHAPAPTLLALDTATETLHLALLAGGMARTEQHAGGAQASATLVPAAQALLAAAGASWSTLDAIAFGRGPGAFTGLRTAAAVAQGLAFGAGKPVIALDTLLAVAEDARQAAALAGHALSHVWAATDARMGEIYAAAYRRAGDCWQAVTEPLLLRPADFAARVQADVAALGGQVAVAGNALRAHADALADALAALPSSVSRWPDAAPRGAALLALAQAAWADGATLDAALALPLYVRDKVAQTTAERLAARAVAS